eukprot:14491_1
MAKRKKKSSARLKARSRTRTRAQVFKETNPDLIITGLGPEKINPIIQQLASMGYSQDEIRSAVKQAESASVFSSRTKPQQIIAQLVEYLSVLEEPIISDESSCPIIERQENGDRKSASPSSSPKSTGDESTIPSSEPSFSLHCCSKQFSDMNEAIAHQFKCSGKKSELSAGTSENNDVMMNDVGAIQEAIDPIDLTTDDVVHNSDMNEECSAPGPLISKLEPPTEIQSVVNQDLRVPRNGETAARILKNPVTVVYSLQKNMKQTKPTILSHYTTVGKQFHSVLGLCGYCGQTANISFYAAHVLDCQQKFTRGELVPPKPKDTKMKTCKHCSSHFEDCDFEIHEATCKQLNGKVTCEYCNKSKIPKMYLNSHHESCPKIVSSQKGILSRHPGKRRIIEELVNESEKKLAKRKRRKRSGGIKITNAEIRFEAKANASSGDAPVTSERRLQSVPSSELNEHPGPRGVVRGFAKSRSHSSAQPSSSGSLGLLHGQRSILLEIERTRKMRANPKEKKQPSLACQHCFESFPITGLSAHESKCKNK